MTKQQYLLHKLIEECSEVQKDTCKALIFGLYDGYPGATETNQQRIEREVQDLYTILYLLRDECGFDFSPNDDKIQEHQAKVNHYYSYAREHAQINRAVQRDWNLGKKPKPLGSGSTVDITETGKHKSWSSRFIQFCKKITSKKG
jgi:hypothetical protein